LLKNAPSFSTSGELSGVDKEEVNSYYGQSVPSERITDLTEVRADEARQQRELQADPTSPDLPEPTTPGSIESVKVNRDLAATDLTQSPAGTSQAPVEEDRR